MQTLSRHGTPWEELEAELREAGKDDVDWRNGRVPMFIHYAGDDVLEVAKRAYLMYFSENGLGQRVFGSLARFEREVVEMGLGLLHGGPAARGAMTTGGTESIFLAVKAAREFARKNGAGGPGSNIVLPRSAHPAFDKAAHFMDLKTVRTPLQADYRADPSAIDAAITPDTIMVVGSVPAYPHGVIDPIEAMAELARKRDVWMHVDACVGGYIAPFALQVGADIPPWDFALPGVTSISADLHKYGYSAKGASTVFFSCEEAFAGMGWTFDDWPRGSYFTNTLVGTRAGGAIAAAWAVMKFLGEEGYQRITRRVLASRQQLSRGAAELGLPTFGNPQLSILAYGSASHDIAGIGQALSAKGWIVGHTNEPAGIHHMLNLTHEPVMENYLSDLAQAIRTSDAAGISGQTPDARY